MAHMILAVKGLGAIGLGVGPREGMAKGVKLFVPHELQSIFPTQFNGHGFLIRDYIRDPTKLQEHLNVHCSEPLKKANIDSSSHDKKNLLHPRGPGSHSL